MENSDLNFTILDFDISFNFDIFEIGIVNLILTILCVAIYLINNLPIELKRRKDSIIKKIEDAEIKLKEAQQRLRDVTKQFRQIDIVVSYIRNESILTKKKLLSADLIEAETELKIQFERAFNTYFSKERIVFLEIKKKVILLVLNQLVQRSQETFSSFVKANRFINKIIDNLELKGKWL